MAKKGRSTVYNKLTSPEKLAIVLKENKNLTNDFLDYLQTIGRSKGTIDQYRNNLNIFFCWIVDNCDNKSFIDVKKRDLIKFQNSMVNDWGWSSKRVRTVKAAISSLGNFIEDILDDEYPKYRSIIRKIPSPPNKPVREKTVYTEEELNYILSVLNGLGEHEIACALSLAMNSGRRKAELGRFKVSYFDEKNLICSGKIYKTPEPVLTKGGKMLSLYTFSDRFKPYLDEWMEEREKLGIQSKWLFPKIDSKTKELMPNTHKTEEDFDRFARVISKIAEKNFYWHSIRHFCTTWLLRQGYSHNLVQKLIGWDSADMVNEYNDMPPEEEFENEILKGDTIQKQKSRITEI